MINHGRTLLVNVPGGSRSSSDFPGEEFIEPGYLQRALTNELQRIHQFLFGAAPDRLMLNYRARQLVSLIHPIPELAKFLTDLDQRITYWPRESRDLFDGAFGNSVSQLEGLSSTLSLVSDRSEDGNNGQLIRQWVVEVLGPGSVGIHENQPRIQQITEPYTLENGLSSLVPLPDSGLQFRFEEAGAGTKWLVDSVIRPTLDLSTIVSSLAIGGEPLFVEVLGNDASEPFRTFRNIWNTREELAWRLGALVLAFIYRVDQLPPEVALTGAA